LFSTSYTGITSASSPDQNSTGGTLVLDAQRFDFGSTYSNQYLAYFTVTNGGANWSTTNTSGSHAALSAVTIETAPEPGTILLFGTGLIGIGLSRIRRRK
jgi:uncharacterized protein with beta-barrel porin domain